MNLSTFIHSEKDRHGLRSMKIEPTLYRFRDSEQVIAAMQGYSPPSANWDKLYTEAQLRQFGEACAAVAEREHSTDAERVYGKEVAELIRNLIKEMLP